MSLGKKFLSAFVDVSEEENKPAQKAPTNTQPTPPQPYIPVVTAYPQNQPIQTQAPAMSNSKFLEHFETLMNDSNLPGPDYYEFVKMVDAMNLIPDERSKFYAAYVGLQVQGLTKEKLISSAGEYIKAIDADAVQFNTMLQASVVDKVTNVNTSADEKTARMQELSKEIMALQQEIGEMRAKAEQDRLQLEASNAAYLSASAQMKQKIQSDVDKVTAYIQ